MFVCAFQLKGFATPSNSGFLGNQLPLRKYFPFCFKRCPLSFTHTFILETTCCGESSLMSFFFCCSSERDEQRASSAYAWFYFSLSFGALLAKWLIPWVPQTLQFLLIAIGSQSINYGWFNFTLSSQVRTHVNGQNFTAFGITDGCLTLGTICYMMGYCTYVKSSTGIYPFKAWL